MRLPSNTFREPSTTFRILQKPFWDSLGTLLSLGRSWIYNFLECYMLTPRHECMHCLHRNFPRRANNITFGTSRFTSANGSAKEAKPCGGVESASVAPAVHSQAPFANLLPPPPPPYFKRHYFSAHPACKMGQNSLQMDPIGSTCRSK